MRGLLRVLLIGLLAVGLGLSPGCAGPLMEMDDPHHGAASESMTMCVPDLAAVAVAVAQLPEPPHRPFTMLLGAPAPSEKPAPPKRALALDRLCVSLI